MRMTDRDRLQRSLEAEKPSGQPRRQERGAIPDHSSCGSLQDERCCQLIGVHQAYESG